MEKIEAQILKHGQHCVICARLMMRSEAAYRMGERLNVWVCGACYTRHVDDDGNERSA